MSSARTHWLASAIRAHLRSWRIRVWGALLAVLAAFLCTLPLFGLLGFAFAFAISIATSLAGLDLGAALVRRARATPAPGLDKSTSGLRVIAKLWGGAFASGLLLLIVPVALVSLNALRVRNCDFGFGVKALLAMPVLSLLYSSGVGVGLGLVAGGRRRLSNALPYAFFTLAVLASLWSFYSAPPVFFYNPLVGYFPGNLYDENIHFSGAFAWARLFHFACLAVGMALIHLAIDVPTLSARARHARPARSRRRGLAAVALPAIVAGLLWSQSAELGFAIGANDIEDALGGHIQTQHFDIYYPNDGEIAENIERIADDHEFRLAQVERDLGVKTTGRIASFYFDSESEKYRWMGAGRVHMAKPWRGEIYLNHQGFPHEVIRHELTHAVAAEFGSPIFRVSAGDVLGLPVAFNPGLIEGLAVAIDWPNHFRNALTPHQSVKAMNELGMAPPVQHILSASFFAYSGTRSYTTAGSFVRFLLERYGAERVRALYQTGGDFRAAYGRDQEILVLEWSKMIDEVELPPGAAEVVRERFRRGSVFERPCPHYVAREIDRTSELAAIGNLDGAIATWRRVCEEVSGEPRYWLELAQLYIRAKRPDEAASVLERIANDGQGVTSSVRSEAFIELTRLAVDGGAQAKALAYLARAAALPLEDDEARNIAAMRWVLESRGAARAPLLSYFFGARDVPASQRAVVLVGWLAQAAAAEPDNALVHYLVGRNLHLREAPEAAARSLSRALDLGLPDPLLTRECARILAESGYLAGDDTAVQRAVAILLEPQQPRVLRLYGLDWLERLQWRDTGAVPASALRPQDTRSYGHEPPATDRADPVADGGDQATDAITGAGGDAGAIRDSR